MPIRDDGHRQRSPAARLSGVDIRRARSHHRRRWTADHIAAPEGRTEIASACGLTAHVLGPICHYVLVRRDLPLGLMAAMIVHASDESVVNGPVPEGTHAVVLMVRDEAHLRAEAERLEARGVTFVRVVEDQAPYAGALMALGLRPARKEALRRHLSSLPMLR